MEYIDVRGPYPIYFNGSLSYRLPANARSWTVGQARTYAEVYK